MFLAVGLCGVLAWAVAVFLRHESNPVELVIAAFALAAAGVGLMVIVMFPDALVDRTDNPWRVFRLVIYPIMGLLVGTMLEANTPLGEIRFFVIWSAILCLIAAAGHNYLEAHWDPNPREDVGRNDHT